jgi:hypothetical protein
MKKRGFQISGIVLIAISLSSCAYASNTDYREVMGQVSNSLETYRVIDRLEEGKINASFSFPSGLSLLETAVIYDNEVLLDYLLESHWNEVRSEANASLELACANDRLLLMESLLDKGVSPNFVKDGNVDSLCIFRAIANQSLGGIALLKRYGLDLNVENSRGLTPLDYAKEMAGQSKKVFEFINAELRR